jgi:hypothetical protein
VNPLWRAEVSVIVNVADDVPFVGEIRMGTFTAPFINVGWIAQWYAYEPAARIVIAADVLPGAMLPVFQRARGEFWVDVCVNEPPLLQETDPPSATLTGFGEKKYSPVETVAADAGGAVKTDTHSNDATTSVRRTAATPSIRSDGTTDVKGGPFIGYGLARCTGSS